jgi:hypothetical protein
MAYWTSVEIRKLEEATALHGKTILLQCFRNIRLAPSGRWHAGTDCVSLPPKAGAILSPHLIGGKQPYAGHCLALPIGARWLRS